MQSLVVKVSAQLAFNLLLDNKLCEYFQTVDFDFVALPYFKHFKLFVHGGSEIIKPVFDFAVINVQWRGNVV